MYNFNNKTDEQLTELSAAVYAEQKKRFLDKIDTYPKPVASLGSIVKDIRLYREMHGVGLLEAKMVIDYYRSN